METELEPEASSLELRRGERLHGFLCTPGSEPALLQELVPLHADGPRWPGLITVRGPVSALDPVFARQQLPGAVQVRGPSVRALAEGALALVEGVVDQAEQGFLLHAYVPNPRRYRTLQGRVRLVEDAFLTLLRQRRRRAFRRLMPWQHAGAGLPSALLVQLALVGRSSLLVSAAYRRALPAGGVDLARWPAGNAPIVEDRAAPSRAYRKLEEAFAWLDEAPSPGQTCVDLGGAPGGWAWTALKRGARVTAVDRAPLAPPAAGHPGLKMVIGNAFTFRPPAPVDWLLCDVVCEPPRTIALLESWMAGGLCRRLIGTVKFKGTSGYGILASARDRLLSLGWAWLRIKQLQHHQNEVAVLARSVALRS
jgi:23S rRNA (cytidine2498-2'-O)-methyltransferase